MPKITQVYLAGPLFTQAEWLWNRQLASELRQQGFDVFLPQEAATPMISGEIAFDAARIFETNLGALRRSSAVLAVLDGADADSGTCWECGYACAAGIPVIGLRTDLRQTGDDGALNLMLTQSCVEIIKATVQNRTRLSDLVADVCNQLRQAIATHS